MWHSQFELHRHLISLLECNRNIFLHIVLAQWEYYASGPVFRGLRFRGPLIDIMDEGGWGGDEPIWPRQLGPQLEGQTVTADSPHSARLQRWMDGWLEGGEESNGELGWESELWEKLAILPTVLLFCISAKVELRWKNFPCFFFFLCR